VARWISDGGPKRPELENYDLARFEEGAPIRGEHEYAASAPH
jgi:sarcosine oxidase subunit beta